MHCGCEYCVPIKASYGWDGIVEMSCCTLNGGDNTKTASLPTIFKTTNAVSRQKFVTTYNEDDNGNVCSGVEVRSTSAQRGCVCQPNRARPCDFDPSLASDAYVFIAVSSIWSKEFRSVNNVGLVCTIPAAVPVVTMLEGEAMNSVCKRMPMMVFLSRCVGSRANTVAGR
jgi:hypothetical protein